MIVFDVFVSRWFVFVVARCGIEHSKLLPVLYRTRSLYVLRELWECGVSLELDFGSTFSFGNAKIALKCMVYT